MLDINGIGKWETNAVESKKNTQDFFHLAHQLQVHKGLKNTLNNSISSEG